MSVPAGQSDRIQRVIECDVCLNIFDLTTRKPKTLHCGHTFCLFCLETLEKGSNISCPTCKSKTAVRHGVVGDLPTNFSSLSLLESLCEECRNQPWDERCSHCSKKFCKDCKKSHKQDSESDSSNEIEALRKRIEELQVLCNDDKELQSIRRKGDEIIDDINSECNRSIDIIEKHRCDQIEKVQTIINNDITESLSWSKMLETEILSTKHLLKKVSLSYNMAISAGEMSEMTLQCTQAMTSLNEIWKAKPTPTKLTFNTEDKVPEFFTKQIGTLKVSDCDCSTDGTLGNTQQPGKARPDYKSAVFKSMHGTHGSGPGNFSSPKYAARCLGTGNVIVSDHGNQRVHILNNKLQSITIVQNNADNKTITYPWGVAVNQQKQIYIAESSRNRVLIMNENGQYLDTFGTTGTNIGQFSNPIGLFTDSSDLLFACDYGNYRIQIHNPDGKCISAWGHKGSEIGQFMSNPMFVDVSLSGRAIVTDNDGNLYIFTTDGTHIKTIHTGTPPQNIKARGVTTDQYNNIIITDQRGYIVVMTEDLEVICTIGKQGNGPGEMKDPWGVVITKSGDLLVCDSGNHRLQQFQVPYLDR